MPSLSVPQLLAFALSLAGLVVAIVLLSKGSQGRARVTGIIGAVLILLSMISGLVYRLVIDPMLAGAEDATLLTTFAAETVIGSILTGAGMILLTYAIVAASRLPKKDLTLRRTRG